MPIDFLKVDRSSLAASEDEDYRSWLLEAILVFGRDLALTVIAKGVESQEQLSALKGWAARWRRASSSVSPPPASRSVRSSGAARQSPRRALHLLGEGSPLLEVRRADPHQVEQLDGELVHVVTSSSSSTRPRSWLPLGKLGDPAHRGQVGEHPWPVDRPCAGQRPLYHGPEVGSASSAPAGPRSPKAGCSGRTCLQDPPEFLAPALVSTGAVRRIVTPSSGSSTRRISGIALDSSNQ